MLTTTYHAKKTSPCVCYSTTSDPVSRGALCFSPSYIFLHSRTGLINPKTPKPVTGGRRRRGGEHMSISLATECSRYAPF